jgi:ribonuclease Z
LRYCKAEGFSGFEIDHEVVLGGCLYGKIGWLLAFEDTIDITRGASVLIDKISTIRDEDAMGSIKSRGGDRGHDDVTLTGTQGGPSVFNGQAGAGTLVRYGDESNECGALKLQFDTGRGTNMRLSQLGVAPQELNATFLTHTHGDHTEGLADILMLRWYMKGPGIDVMCSNDAVSILGVVHGCRQFVMHVADSFIASGEVEERRSEDKARLERGPAKLVNVITFEPREVWSSGEVRVSAIRSTHIAGHASYRVDTPAGSVVIGGDASNDLPTPPRAHSTSDQVEMLAKGADILVHSARHSILSPERGSGFPAPIYYRQSIASDLGGLAQRDSVKYLMLTHLAPSLGATPAVVWTRGRREAGSRSRGLGASNAARS